MFRPLRQVEGVCLHQKEQTPAGACPCAVSTGWCNKPAAVAALVREVRTPKCAAHNCFVSIECVISAYSA